MFYKICRAIVRFFMLFVFRIKTYGAENVPKNQGAVIAVNHRSYWDIPVAGLTCPQQLTYMAKSELFKNPVFGRLISSLGAFPVKRGRGDIGAVKAALSILAQNRLMLVFPEGTRNRTDAPLEKVKSGIALFATRAQVPVIPVFIGGKYKWFGRVTVTYGKPMYFDEYYGRKLSQEELSEISAKIYNNIWALKGG